MDQGTTVAVVGLGRVGLPLALYLASRGMNVYGVDRDESRVRSLNAGTMPFREEGADEVLIGSLGRAFHPGTKPDVVARCRVIILTLGTPVDEHMNPVFDQLAEALGALIPFLRKGQIFVLRSTVSPGTTELLAHHLERITPFRVGKDLFLAFCPERIAEGRSLAELPEIPQIVGGFDPESTRLAANFFRPVSSKVLPTRARAAELAKLFTNMYRYIDFAIANEFMVIAEGYDEDVHEIVDLVNRDYRRGGLKRPGFTSGPCLFKDGFFLLSKVPFVELISVAWRLHESMPAYLIEQIKRRRSIEGAKAALLGVAFKRNIDDSRNSLSFKLRKLLLAAGCDVCYHDPYLPSDPMESCLRGADLVFIGTDHDAFRIDAMKAYLGLPKPDALVSDIWNLWGHGTIFPLAELSAEGS